MESIFLERNLNEYAILAHLLQRRLHFRLVAGRAARIAAPRRPGHRATRPRYGPRDRMGEGLLLVGRGSLGWWRFVRPLRLLVTAWREGGAFRALHEQRRLPGGLRPSSRRSRFPAQKCDEE